MKTLVLSMISIAATLAAMTACTSEGDPIDEGTKDTPVEIKMSAGILNIETRSSGPINEISKLTEAVNDVMFVKVEAEKNVADNDLTWATSPTKHEATIAASSGNITFTDIPYYSSDVEKYSYLIGYHPSTDGTLSGNEVSYTINGNMDIMLSTVVNGNKDSKGTTLAPKFSHKLAQLIIKITGNSGTATAEKDASAAAAAWGDIESIKVKDVATNVKLNLSTKSLTASDATSTPLEIIKKDASYPAISTTTEEAGYCMILPQETAKAYILTVKTKNAEKDVTVTIPAGDGRGENITVAGESYVITLTFKANEIKAQATIEPWKTGTENGSGSVD